MRRFLFVALLCFTASASLFSVDANPSPDQQTPAATPGKLDKVEGWPASRADVEASDFRIVDFSVSKVGGGAINAEDLRGRWTIVGCWNSSYANIQQEAHYLRALNSAVDQDPDLDLLVVYLKLEASDPDAATWFANNGGAPWSAVTGGEFTPNLFGFGKVPFYFLIGPDLTIHAVRGPLSEDPDGIKPVIRGVAEIRKKAASPQ